MKKSLVNNNRKQSKLLCNCISSKSNRSLSSPVYSENKNKLILINCTSCISKTTPTTTTKAKIISDKKLINNTRNSKNCSINNNNNNNNNNTKTLISSNSIKKKPKYITQFSIRFHKFSLRSSSFSALTRNKNFLKRSALDNNTNNMNQRCCLSVSVVPFERLYGNNNNNNNNNGATTTNTNATNANNNQQNSTNNNGKNKKNNVITLFFFLFLVNLELYSVYTSNRQWVVMKKKLINIF